MANEQKQSVKYRIGYKAAILLLLIAAIFDFSELVLDIFLPGLGGFLKDFAQIFFFPAVFWVFGAPLWKGRKKTKKLVAGGISLIISFIPILSSIVPEVVIWVAMTIYYSRQEDKEKFKDSNKAKKDANIVRQKRERQKVRQQSEEYAQ